MTERQADKLREKIKAIKAALAADKRRWAGFYDDSRGLRYMPPQYYLKLGDFAGGLRYFKWFQKNFPDDAGFPDFLFEWTVVLFMTGHQEKAERKAFEAYISNTYIFDKFFGRAIVPIDKYESSNVNIPGFTDYFRYSSSQAELSVFSHWLEGFIQTERFLAASAKFIEIEKKLNTEDDDEMRYYLVRQAEQLQERF
jgi:hypothetical protein